MNTAEAPKPLRKDALINRQRILDAAAELFAQRGLGVTLNDIAHHAGVGVGTVYRRFPDKDALIEDLFEQRFQDMIELAEGSLGDPDPWRGLCGFLERALEMKAGNRGLRDLVFAMPNGLEKVRQNRDRLLPLGEEVVRRAQQSGRLRADISAQDLPIVQMMVAGVIDDTRDLNPDLWRRYMQILLRGLSADPDNEPALSVPPLSAESLDVVMSRPTGPRT
jgi:AcrR family transcriptional regulator